MCNCSSFYCSAKVVHGTLMAILSFVGKEENLHMIKELLKVSNSSKNLLYESPSSLDDFSIRKITREKRETIILSSKKERKGKQSWEYFLKFRRRTFTVYVDFVINRRYSVHVIASNYFLVQKAWIWIWCRV